MWAAGRNIQITRLPMFPQYVGKRLSEVAQAEGISEVDVYIRTRPGRRRRRHRPHDVRGRHEDVLSAAVDDGGERRRRGVSHPRGAGTFPRVLGRFVRDEQWLTLPDAIRKMTVVAGGDGWGCRIAGPSPSG